MKKLSGGARSCFAGLLVFILLILFFPASASAHHKEEVLGDSTPSAELVFPPVTSGTGFILPDSPLFFLDRFFQQAKLFFAFSSEARAKVRVQVAGERLAELRAMFAKDNETGINTSLDLLAQEAELAAKDITNAAAQGADVRLLAKQLNEEIKFQRKLLNVLADQIRGPLRDRLKAARATLKEAKLEVEDELPEEDLENEIEEDLADEIENEVEEASESAKKVQSDLVKLEREASRSAAKALNRREEAVKKAIEKRDEVLKKVEEKLLEAEKKKQESLLKAQNKAAEQAQEALKKAQEAASKFKEARGKVTEIKAVPVGGTSGGSGLTETPKPVSNIQSTSGDNGGGLNKTPKPASTPQSTSGGGTSGEKD